MWNVTAYKNTGLNSVNTLDNPSRLNNADSINLPPLSILQGEHLSSIDVKATRAQIKDVDYLSLEDTESGDVFFYSVENFAMSSMDVAHLSILPDAYLTLCHMAGGIQNVKFADGIVERHHVPKSSDTFGRYTEHDPYLIPSRELVVDIQYMFPLQYPTLPSNFTIIIESTLDLVAMADATDARTYVDEETGQSVTVPNTRSVSSFTRVDLYDVQASVSYVTSGTAYFDFNNKKVRDGIERARALGVEGGILNAYIVPTMAIYENNTTITDGKYDSIYGALLEEACRIPFEYATSRNKRVLYGDLNAYELTSISSGMSVRYKPEEITGGGGSAPTFSAVYDPRPNGRPYFRSKYYRGVDTTAAADGAFFANAVAGSEWANAPLAYTGKSGSTLDEIRYETNKIINRNNANAAFDTLARTTENQLNNLQGQAWGEAAQNMFNGLTGADMGEFLGGMAGAVATMWSTKTTANEITANYEAAQKEATRRYKQNALDELQNHLINTQVVAPQLHFPNSATMRDFIGNGIVIVKYRLHNDDIEKCNRILDMYGYRDTTTITNDIFTNRSKFNFVKINGVSITGDIPKWIRELAAAQFSAGVRIWHKLPDVNDYNGGND